MKKIAFPLAVCLLILFTSCKNGNVSVSSPPPPPPGVVNSWNLGIGLFTFHTLDFVEALKRVDSSGLKYIEPTFFQKAGPEFKDSIISQLSPAGVEKIKAIIQQHGFTAESMYAGGDETTGAWKHQFELARQLGLKFITAEPPVTMWDTIDSLAGVYGIKVALHEHWKGVSRYWHPDTVLAAIKGHPNFGACADLGHWPKSGINPVEGVKKLSGHIICIHLKDCAEFNNIKIQDVRVGTGVVDFPAVFKELKKQKFSGNIYIERDATDPQGNLPSVMETIKYYNNEVSKLK